METKYDAEVDVITIVIQNGNLDHGEDMGDGVIVHYNKDNIPIEIEILNAKSRLVDWIKIALNSGSKPISVNS